jgi:cell division protein FtsQ
VSAISTWHPAKGSALVAAEPLAPTRTGRRAGRWAVLIVGAAIVVGAGWWVTNSPVFDMHSLKVEGGRHLSASQVRELSGLGERSNVLWLDAGAVESRLEQDPWVREAVVKRRLPSGITIHITERAAVAVVGKDPAMVVAVDGTVLGVAPSSIRLPMVEMDAPLAIGERITVGPELAAVGALPGSLRPRVKAMARDAAGALILLMRSGMTVFYGDASDPQAKAIALRAVLAWAERHGVHPTYVDVRAPAAPALGTSGGTVPVTP